MSRGFSHLGTSGMAAPGFTLGEIHGGKLLGHYSYHGGILVRCTEVTSTVVTRFTGLEQLGDAVGSYTLGTGSSSTGLYVSDFSLMALKCNKISMGHYQPITQFDVETGKVTVGTTMGTAVVGDIFAIVPTSNIHNIWIYTPLEITFAAVTTGSQTKHEILTVTGLNRVRIMAVVGAADVTGSGSIQLGDETTTDALIGATTGSALDIGELWYTTTSTLKAKHATDCILDYVTNGLDLGYEITSNTLTGGVVTFHMWWQPLSPGAYCVVATGADASL